MRVAAGRHRRRLVQEHHDQAQANIEHGQHEEGVAIAHDRGLAVHDLGQLLERHQRAQGMGDAALMALKQLSQIVHRQAAVMSYSDAFFILTLFYVALTLLVMLVNKPALPAGGGGGGH